MESGCHNYYHGPDGANVTQWPGTHLVYLVATRVLRRFGIRAVPARRRGREPVRADMPRPSWQRPRTSTACTRSASAR